MKVKELIEILQTKCTGDEDIYFENLDWGGDTFAEDIKISNGYISFQAHNHDFLKNAPVVSVKHNSEIENIYTHNDEKSEDELLKMPHQERMSYCKNLHSFSFCDKCYNAPYCYQHEVVSNFFHFGDLTKKIQLSKPITLREFIRVMEESMHERKVDVLKISFGYCNGFIHNEDGSHKSIFTETQLNQMINPEYKYDRYYIAGDLWGEHLTVTLLDL